MRSRKAEKPFFIWLALTSPHDPRTPPEEYRNRYAPADLPLPPAFAPEPAFDNGELQVRDELLCEKPLQPEVLRQHLADYYGMISHQDREIGRVLEALRASGQEENTLIVYVGDHGLALGRNGLLGKQNLYEHSVRVPMILVGPGVPSGRTDQALTYSMDLFATLLDLAGLSVPEYLDSLSLLPRLNHRGGGERRELFSLYRDCQRSLRDDRWKLIEYKVNSTRHTQLFDLSIDPHEGQDRAGDPAQTEIIRSMRDRLRTWQKRLGDRWMTLEPESSDHSMRV